MHRAPIFIFSLIAFACHVSIGQINPPWIISNMGNAVMNVHINSSNWANGQTLEQGDIVGAYVCMGGVNLFVGVSTVQDTSGAVDLQLKAQNFADPYFPSIGDTLHWRAWNPVLGCSQELVPKNQMDHTIINSNWLIVDTLKGYESLSLTPPHHWKICETQLPWKPALPFGSSFLEQGWFPGPNIVFDSSERITNGTILDSTTYLTRSSEFCDRRDTALLTVSSVPSLNVSVRPYACNGQVSVTVQTNFNFTWETYGVERNLLLPNHSSLGYAVQNQNCLTLDQLVIEVEEVDFSHLNYEILPPTCEEGRQYNIDASEIPFADSLKVYVDTIPLDSLEQINSFAPGNYSLLIVDPTHCIDTFKYSLDLNVLPSPAIEGMSYELQDVICEDLGSVQLDSSEWVALGISSVKVDGMNFTTPELDNLQDQEYAIYAINQYGCESETPLEIEIKQTPCSEFAIYPFEDTPLNSGTTPRFVKIDSEGQITVVDRNGQVVRTLNGPTQWDGRDNSGNIVPTGMYFIQSQAADIKSVTVIK